jgi:hypothetical protein
MSENPFESLLSFLEDQQQKLGQLREKLRGSDDGFYDAIWGIECQNELVRQLHIKLKVDQVSPLKSGLCNEEAISMLLTHSAETLSTVATGLMALLRVEAFKDQRAKRIQLIVEEAAELCDALARNDEMMALDALADLDYVVHGTAVALDLPLSDAFAEVHKSNMTKNVCHRQPGMAPGDKGPDYKPPKIAETLESYRRAQLRPHKLVNYNNNNYAPTCANCDKTIEIMLQELNKYGRSKCDGGAM